MKIHVVVEQDRWDQVVEGGGGAAPSGAERNIILEGVDLGSVL